MNHLTDLDNLKSFLKLSGFKPKDYMGQNFLVDEDVLQKIITAANLKKTDTVLEVGPGLGVLTEQLLKKAGRVVAVEKDERLVELLKNRFSISNGVRDPSYERFLAPLEMVKGDILCFHLDQHISGPYKVVANIPYYLTSKLFQYFLQQTNKPQVLVIMVQKEVGERVVAKPGELSVLGISVQIAADAEIVGPAGRVPLAYIISKTSFWPVPEVDSVILKITPRDKYGSQITDHRLFFSIVKKAFAGKRKQLHNTLGKEVLEKVGIDPTARPQELSIEQWISIYKGIS